MDGINDILNSLSEEDMNRLKSVAANLTSGASQQKTAPNNGTADLSALNSMLSGGAGNMLGVLSSALGKDNEKTAFLKSLRPLLSEERRQKVDEAVRFLRLMDSLPLLRGLFK